MVWHPNRVFSLLCFVVFRLSGWKLTFGALALRQSESSFLQFFKFKLVSNTLRIFSCKTCLFSYAFRLTIVDFFREFYKQMLNACI